MAGLLFSIMFVCLPCLCLLHLHLLACLAGWVLCLLVACWAGQRSSGEDSYLTKLPCLRKNIMSAVGYLGTKHDSWEEQQDEQIVLVQGGMVHLSRCARAMWIHRLCFRSLVLKPLVWGSQLCWVHWPPVVFGVAEIPMGCLSCPWLNWLHCLLVCASEQMLASSDLLYVLFWCV